ncbi:hypothetical protein GQ53DRAFT_620238, partial [Thozetella sp. PMI_491]
SLLPKKIWQIILSPVRGSVHEARGIPAPDVSSWVDKNPFYTYKMLSDEGAGTFLRTYYANRTDILDLYEDLKNPAMKSDFLRYLILLAEGGIYTDLDTTALKGIDEWIPDVYKPKVRLITGVEYDEPTTETSTEPGDMVYRLQFGQWSLGCVPGHGLMQDMVAEVESTVNELAATQGAAIKDMHIPDGMILNMTGPVAWTTRVWAYIREADPNLKDLTDLSGMKEPRLYGDVLILPINAFTSGQLHSGSTWWWTPSDALSRHRFKGSWRDSS